MGQETWVPVVEFEGEYEVSNTGKIRSLKGPAKTPLKPWLSGSRRCMYLSCYLWKGGKRFKKKVHHAVLEAFLGPRPSINHEACHIDGDKLNNRAENLRWGTRLDNLEDRRRHGTDPSGSRNGRSKLTETEVSQIKRRLMDGHKQKDIAKDYGVYDTMISKINTRECWAHVRAAGVATEGGLEESL